MCASLQVGLFLPFHIQKMTLFFIQSTTVNSHNFNFPGLEELHSFLTFIMTPFHTFMHLINFTLLDFSKITGVGSHSLLQGIFPIQGLNPSLLLCRQILCYLSYQGSPKLGHSGRVLIHQDLWSYKKRQRERVRERERERDLTHRETKP